MEEIVMGEKKRISGNVESLTDTQAQSGTVYTKVVILTPTGKKTFNDFNNECKKKQITIGNNVDVDYYENVKDNRTFNNMQAINKVMQGQILPAPLGYSQPVPQAPPNPPNFAPSPASESIPRIDKLEDTVKLLATCIEKMKTLEELIAKDYDQVVQDIQHRMVAIYTMNKAICEHLNIPPEKYKTAETV